MSENELKNIVENIVTIVLKRLESDPELAKLFSSPKHSETTTFSQQWARTCTSDYLSKPQPKVQHSQMGGEKRLYTEMDMLELGRNGIKQLIVQPRTIITPAARDAAHARGIDIIINRSVPIK